MTTYRFALLTAVSMVVVALPICAQERGRPAAGSGSQGTGGGASIVNRGVAVGNSTPSPAVTTTAPRGFESSNSSVAPSGHYGSGTSGFRTYSQPNLEHTSFYSVGTYYQWQQFIYRLQYYYVLNPSYFRRFYRNQEPLVTPQLVKMALRSPVALSLRMVGAVEELEALLADVRNGKTVDKQAIAAKSKEIRELASKIRKDDTLAFIDSGADKDVTKGLETNSISPEALAHLREMAVDLHTQLKALYASTTTSTVSVDALTQPSFASLSKGIEKLARGVENSSRKL